MKARISSKKFSSERGAAALEYSLLLSLVVALSAGAIIRTGYGITTPLVRVDYILGGGSDESEQLIPEQLPE